MRRRMMPGVHVTKSTPPMRWTSSVVLAGAPRNSRLSRACLLVLRRSCEALRTVRRSDTHREARQPGVGAVRQLLQQRQVVRGSKTPVVGLHRAHLSQGYHLCGPG